MLDDENTMWRASGPSTVSAPAGAVLDFVVLIQAALNRTATLEDARTLQACLDEMPTAAMAAMLLDTIERLDTSAPEVTDAWNLPKYCKSRGS